MAHGVEVALGVVRDPGLGPLVMVAAGGTATEVWDDRRLLLAPVTAQDAAGALRSLRIWPLLAGFRGSAPVDEQALVRPDRRARRLARRRTRARRGRPQPGRGPRPTGASSSTSRSGSTDRAPVDAGVPGDSGPPDRPAGG